MARSIKQIQQELDNIQETVAELANELETLYDKYLLCLSQSASKQLILAGYQLCTQIYPEAFVALPLTQRQKLQQALRTLGQDMEPMLIKKPEAADFNQEQADLSLIAEMLKKLPLERSSETTETPKNTDQSVLNDNEETAALEIEEENQNQEEITAQEIQELALDKIENLTTQKLNKSPIDEIDLSNPHHLMMWYKKIESKIRQILENTSRQANKNLQQFDIVSKRLPSKVIDVALQAKESNSGGKLRKIPNIINLVIETEKKSKNQPSIATHISLLQLRLSEIEFADAKLSNQRNQIRAVVKKIKHWESLYQNREQEYTVAEADAAWRSSWYEE